MCTLYEKVQINGPFVHLRILICVKKKEARPRIVDPNDVKNTTTVKYP